MKWSSLAVRTVGFVVLMALCLTAQHKKFAYGKRDKAFYADPALVAFVRPGLGITINSASISNAGAVTVNFTLTDPSGLPLDVAGVYTPVRWRLLTSPLIFPVARNSMCRTPPLP